MEAALSCILLVAPESRLKYKVSHTHSASHQTVLLLNASYAQSFQYHRMVGRVNLCGDEVSLQSLAHFQLCTTPTKVHQHNIARLSAA